MQTVYKPYLFQSFLLAVICRTPVSVSIIIPFATGEIRPNMAMFRAAVKAEMSKQAEPQKLNLVQVGAFSSKTNSENFLKEIKAKGLVGI